MYKYYIADTYTEYKGVYVRTYCLSAKRPQTARLNINIILYCIIYIHRDGNKNYFQT